MKEYKLKEEELVASFSPLNPTQPPPYPPQTYPLQHQPYPYPYPAHPRAPVPNMVHHQHVMPNSPPPQIIAAHQQRSNNPSVVFNYNENQRESIVQSVGVPGRQPKIVPQQMPGVQRQQQRIPQAPQPTPASTPQQNFSRGSSNGPYQQPVANNMQAPYPHPHYQYHPQAPPQYYQPQPQLQPQVPQQLVVQNQARAVVSEPQNVVQVPNTASQPQQQQLQQPQAIGQVEQQGNAVVLEGQGQVQPEGAGIEQPQQIQEHGEEVQPQQQQQPPPPPQEQIINQAQPQPRPQQNQFQQQHPQLQQHPQHQPYHQYPPQHQPFHPQQPQYHPQHQPHYPQNQQPHPPQHQPQYPPQYQQPQYEAQPYPYQGQQGHPEGEEQNLQEEMNELSPEERERIWMEQQQMQEQYQQGQYEYPPGEGGYEYPPEYYQQGYNELTPEYFEALQGEATLWKERFFYLYQKFQTFCQKYQGLNKEGSFLGQQFLAVDSEQQWLALKQKYDSLIERMGEVKEQNFLILQEIQENIQQNQKIENSASIKEQASRVWEHRYHELLEQYQSLSHHYAELQSSSMAHNDMDENDRVAMMNEKYSQLENEYNNVVQQLQNSQNAMQIRQEHEDLLKYTQQLQGYIQQLQTENNNLMRGMKISVEGSKTLKESEINHKMIEKENEIRNLTDMIMELQQKIEKGEARPKSNKSKDVKSSQLENQIQEMTLYCNQLQQKLTMKDYEINGLKDRIQYLEEELNQKKDQLKNFNSLLEEKLSKIQAEIATKVSQPAPAVIPAPQQPSALSSFSLEQDYQARIKEYQRSIQGKNNEIRILEERIAESESQTRKVSLERSSLLRQWQEKVDAIEQEHRRKVLEKDSKIRALEYDLQEKEAEVQKKVHDKDNAVKLLESQISSLKDDYESRIVEKDSIIKGLRENNQRLNIELKDKISQMSRIKSPVMSPNMRSPNQSFIADNFRHEEELRLLSDQVERRADEINKLKKERDSRNKQYKDLELEYQALQEENNKRRIEINNLKRQSMTIQNLQLEVDNLRATITKKNTEIGELKNSLFQLDRVKMELDSAKREAEKQTEISKMKTRDIEQLTDRNFELEEKIRQKDFKNSQKTELLITKNYSEETMRLQEDNRRKEMDVNKMKIENEELTRNLRRVSEELEELKVRYPPKLKQTEEELIDVKLKLGTIEKKYMLADNRAKQLEENMKRIKTLANQEQNNEASRIQENYTKLVQRLQEDNKNLKEKIRTYEVKVHDLEVESNSMVGRIRQYQMFKDDNAKKIITLNERLQEKDIEIKKIRDKQSDGVLRFRKKETKTIELEAALKSRDEQARQFQKQKEMLRIQLKTLRKEYQDYKQHMIEQLEKSTNKEMENISKQLNQYEAKFALQSHNYDFKIKDKTANQVFERTIIYQLKEENDFLRRQLQGRGSSISLQKLRITQLQQQALMKSKHMTAPPSQSVQEELQFYRNKNRELEERVNSHIAVNKNLKERIQQLAESNSKVDEIERQRLKIVELETAYNELQSRFSKLVEENAHLRNELGNSAIAEADTFEVQARIQELSRNIDQLTLQRNSLIEQVQLYKRQKEVFEGRCHELEKNLTKSQNKIGILDSEIARLKQMSKSMTSNGDQRELKRQIEELMLRIREKEGFEMKCYELQKNLTRSQNKMGILESELDRLRQTNKAMASNADQRQLKGQIDELISKMREKEGRCYELENNLIRSQNKIGILESQIDRLKQMNKSMTSNADQRQIKQQLEQLLIQIREKDNVIAQQNSRATYFENENYKLENLVRELQEQMQLLQNNFSHNDSSQTDKWKTAVESLEGSVQQMSEKINQLEGEAEYYKTQAQKSGGIPEDVFYFLEIVRSNYLQLESLSSQMSIESEQMASLGERIIENCRRGLESCQYINELLSG